MVDRNLSNTKTGLLIWKASNLWQQILRQSLKKYELTLNEFLILEALLNVKDDSVDITQITIGKSRKTSTGTMMLARNPVTVISATKV